MDWQSQSVHYFQMDTNEEINDLRNKLAEEIKALRSEMGLSQEALALSANVDRSYVSQLERGIGNPTLIILKRISDALGAKVCLSLIKKDIRL